MLTLQFSGNCSKGCLGHFKNATSEAYLHSNLDCAELKVFEKGRVTLLKKFPKPPNNFSTLENWSLVLTEGEAFIKPKLLGGGSCFSKSKKNSEENPSTKAGFPATVMQKQEPIVTTSQNYQNYEVAERMLGLASQGRKSDVLECIQELELTSETQVDNPFEVALKVIETLNLDNLQIWAAPLKYLMVKTLRPYLGLALKQQKSRIQRTRLDNYQQILKDLASNSNEKDIFELHFCFEVQRCRDILMLFSSETFTNEDKSRLLVDCGKVILGVFGISDALDAVESILSVAFGRLSDVFKQKKAKVHWKLLLLQSYYIESKFSELDNFTEFLKNTSDWVVKFEGITLLFDLLCSNRKLQLLQNFKYLACDSEPKVRFKMIFEVIMLMGKLPPETELYQELNRILNERTGINGEKKSNIVALINNPTMLYEFEALISDSWKVQLEQIEDTYNKFVTDKPSVYEKLKERIKKLNQDLEEKEYYISPVASDKQLANSHQTFDLKSKVTELIFNSQVKSILIMGEAGSGKTLFSKLLTIDLAWDPECEYLPLYIWLAKIEDIEKNFINGVLKYNGLEDYKEELKTKKVLFVCDGHDEIEYTGSLIEKGTLSEHFPESKWVFLCRSYHSHKLGLSTFSPRTENKILDHLRKDLYIQPFNNQMIESFLTKISGFRPKSFGPSECSEFIFSSPSILELVKFPLLLYFIYEAYPSLKGKKAVKKYEVYRFFTLEFYKNEQNKRLGGNVQEEDYESFAKELAYLMTLEKVELFSVREESSMKRHFLSVDEKVQRGCLIKAESKYIFKFIHKTLKEFYFCEHIFDLVNKDLKQAVECLNSVEFAGEKVILEFFKDVFIGNSESLLEIVYKSKENPNLARAAANAITILNFCNYSFSGLDLSCVSIPGANLSNCVMQRTKLSNSNLKGVNFLNAVLDEAVLDSCDLQNANFGERPSLSGHTGAVNSLCFASNTEVVSGSNDKKLKMWSLSTKEVLRTIPAHFKKVNCVLVSKEFIISGSQEGSIKVFNYYTCEAVRVLEGHSDSVNSLSRSKNFLVSGSRDGLVIVWNWELAEVVHRMQGHKGWVLSVGISKNCVVSGGRDETIRVWSQGNHLKTLEGHKGWVKSLCVSKDCRFLVSGSKDSTIKIWDFEECVKTLIGHASCVNVVLLTRDCRFVLSGSKDGTIRIWEFESGDTLKTLCGNKGEVYALALSKDEKSIVSGGKDKKVTLWDFEADEAVKTLEAHRAEVTCISVEGKYFATSSNDRSLRVWDLENGELLRKIPTTTGYISCVCLHQNFVLSGGNDKKVRVWNLNTGEAVKVLSGHTAKVRSVVCTAENAVSGANDRTIRVWNLDTGEAVRVLRTGETVNKVAILNERFIVASQDASVKVWDFYSEEEVTTLSLEESSCLEVWGDLVVAGNRGSCVTVWNAETWEVVSSYSTNQKDINCIGVCKDYLASGSKDGTVQVSNSQTLKGSGSSVSCVFVSSNYLIFGDSEGRVFVFGESSGEFLLKYRIGTGYLSLRNTSVVNVKPSNCSLYDLVASL